MSSFTWRKNWYLVNTVDIVDIVGIMCVDIMCLAIVNVCRYCRYYMCRYVYVPSDLLGELAGVGRVELDPEVEGDGGDALDLLRHALPGLQPVLNTKIFVNRQKIFIRNMHRSFSKDKPEDKEINRSKIQIHI